MKYNALIAWLVLLSFCLPAISYAQTITLQPIPPGDDQILFLQMGQPAPYDGQLFDNPTAMRWGNWLRQWKLRYEIDMKEQAQLCTNDKNLAQYKLELEQQKYNQVVATYAAEVTRLNTQLSQPTPWYKTQTFGIGIGVASTLVLTGVVVYGVSQVK